MIQAKKERNYRRGYTGRNCSGCDHFLYNAAGRGDHRCSMIGLNGGRGYRVLSHYICDDYDNTYILAKLRGESC